jgi:hypothetical protein
MPVIFDQVVARVEPETARAPEPEGHSAQPVEVHLEDIRHRLGVMLQRATRLRAD